MVAALTTVPVIGVPVKSSSLNGVDSLYSIVQMPPGIPVATVAINGAKNAGLLAAQILGSFDDTCHANVMAYKKSLETMVEEKAKQIEEIGYEAYLEKM
jgi:5-(carboxyamino)imidazole ribonucleotide mutase